MGKTGKPIRSLCFLFMDLCRKLQVEVDVILMIVQQDLPTIALLIEENLSAPLFLGICCRRIAISGRQYASCFAKEKRYCLSDGELVAYVIY